MTPLPRFLRRRCLPLTLLLTAPSPSALAFAFASPPVAFAPRRGVVEDAMTISKASRRSLSSVEGSAAPAGGGEPFRPPAELRGLFVGSGSDGMSHPSVAPAALDLTDGGRGRGRRPEDATVLYLGTATYDLKRFCDRQTARFRERGCQVTSLDVAMDPVPSRAKMERRVARADVIVVGGGNTLYAVDRWRSLGIDGMLRDAAERGAVLTGGSAGAICWFDGGHSDSADPDTYREAMLDKFGGGGSSSPSAGAAVADESSAAPVDPSDAASWSYLRVSGLSVLPGLVCPHHDVTQSNGLLRSSDFDSLLLRHPGEAGIGIDHWAALEVRGERFRVHSVEGKPGSVAEDGRYARDRDGSPGVWIKEVIGDGEGGGTVKRRLCPAEGKVAELLRFPEGEIIRDERVERCRGENPIPS